VRFSASGSGDSPKPSEPKLEKAPSPPPPQLPPGVQSAKLTQPVPQLEPAIPLAPTKVSGGPANVAGVLPAKKTTEIIGRHINELRFCHESNRGVPARVQLALDMVVSAKGAVEQAAAKAETNLDPAFTQCLEAATKRWTFPSSKGESSSVTYPVVFERAQ